MKKIINPYLENLHSYNGKLHEEYTTSIYNIVYDTFQDKDFSNLLGGYVEPNKIIERAREIVFDFDYPIINYTFENQFLGTLNLKDSFEKAFVRKFLTDEIAYESFTLWKAKLIGKIEETIPMLNLKFNMFLEITPRDLRGGYSYVEKVDNTHSDTDVLKGTNVGTNKGTQKNEGNSVSSEFPVNDIDAYNNLGDVDYASNGVINKNTRTDNLTNTMNRDETNKNNGEYETNRTIDKADRNLIENLTKIRRILDSYISDYLNEFQYLFLGIL